MITAFDELRQYIRTAHDTLDLDTEEHIKVPAVLDRLCNRLTEDEAEAVLALLDAAEEMGRLAPQ